MSRDLLFERLARYGARHADEGPLVARFESFVRAHGNCFERTCIPGHITGSAWVTDPAGQQVLLTHHRKLDLWVQLGGHSDGDSDTLDVALREATEESGLEVEPVSVDVFDLDCHLIPARRDEPEHYHYDVRFWLRATGTDFTVTEESHDLRWVDADTLPTLTREESMLRMLRKWQAATGRR